MLNDLGRLPDSYGAFGCPYHGQVREGALALPNAQSIPHPQPESGDTFLIEVPGAPGVDRTPEQEAEDAARGWQWWTQAILSGSDARIYGQALGLHRWIYVDPEGTRWLVRPQGPFGSYDTLDVYQPADVEFLFVRFGEFPAPAVPEEYTRSATVTDWQQQSTRLDVNHLRVALQDTTPTGNKAVWSIWRDAPAHTLGFFEVVITGSGEDISVAVNVVRTRDQTIGTRSELGLDLYSPEGEDATWREVQFLWDATQTQLWQTVSDNRDFNTCTGKAVDHFIPEIGSWGPVDLVEEPYWGVMARIHQGTRAESLAGRVVQMWYDETGTLVPLEIEMDHDIEWTLPEPTIDVDPSIRERVLSGSPPSCTTTTTITHKGHLIISQSCTKLETFSWRLKRGGMVVLSVSGSRTYTTHTSIRYPLQHSDWPPGRLRDDADAFTSDYGIAPVWTFQSTGYELPVGRSETLNWPGFVASGFGHPTTAERDAGIGMHGWQRDRVVWWGRFGYTPISHRLWRGSNKVLGTRANLVPGSASWAPGNEITGPDGDFVFRGVATPGAAANDVLLTKPMEGAWSVSPQASWCPVTHQVAFGWNQAGTQFESVCWV